MNTCMGPVLLQLTRNILAIGRSGRICRHTLVHAIGLRWLVGHGWQFDGDVNVVSISPSFALHRHTCVPIITTACTRKRAETGLWGAVRAARGSCVTVYDLYLSALVLCWLLEPFLFSLTALSPSHTSRFGAEVEHTRRRVPMEGWRGKVHFWAFQRFSTSTESKVQNWNFTRCSWVCKICPNIGKQLLLFYFEGLFLKNKVYTII